MKKVMMTLMAVVFASQQTLSTTPTITTSMVVVQVVRQHVLTTVAARLRTTMTSTAIASVPVPAGD